MPWSDLAFQFCMELAFGVLLALAFVPKAPVGTMFYRVMGTSALVPVLAGLGISLSAGSLEPSSPIVVAGALVLLTSPIYSGPVRGARWAFGLGLALLGCVLAVALTIRAATPELGALQLALATTTALATGAVAGSVGLAMVLGHWYLVTPRLPEQPLREMTGLLVVVMVLQMLLLVPALALPHDTVVTSVDTDILSNPFFYLRVGGGMVFAALLAWMAFDASGVRAMMSATGLLYIAMALVLAGEVVGRGLMFASGVPN